jgi:hypothetical protein
MEHRRKVAGAEQRADTICQSKNLFGFLVGFSDSILSQNWDGLYAQTSHFIWINDRLCYLCGRMWNAFRQISSGGILPDPRPMRIEFAVQLSSRFVKNFASNSESSSVDFDSEIGFDCLMHFPRCDYFCTSDLNRVWIREAPSRFENRVLFSYLSRTDHLLCWLSTAHLPEPLAVTAPSAPSLAHDSRTTNYLIWDYQWCEDAIQFGSDDCASSAAQYEGSRFESRQETMVSTSVPILETRKRSWIACVWAGNLRADGFVQPRGKRYACVHSCICRSCSRGSSSWELVQQAVRRRCSGNLHEMPTHWCTSQHIITLYARSGSALDSWYDHNCAIEELRARTQRSFRHISSVGISPT